MEKKSMGSFLTALRKASGLTQKQLAEKLNVSDKAVSRWEQGNVRLLRQPLQTEIL
jgi:transcriptional regulator with XRE-family HTH domain